MVPPLTPSTRGRGDTPQPGSEDELPTKSQDPQPEQTSGEAPSASGCRGWAPPRRPQPGPSKLRQVSHPAPRRPPAATWGCREDEGQQAAAAAAAEEPGGTQPHGRRGRRGGGGGGGTPARSATGAGGGGGRKEKKEKEEEGCSGQTLAQCWRSEG